MSKLKMLTGIIIVEILFLGFVTYTDFPAPLLSRENANVQIGNTTDPNVLAGESLTSYWVSTTGNDANDGSQASPWKTIQKAINSVPNDSVIRVMPGTYQGPVRFTREQAHNIHLVSHEPYMAHIQHNSKIIGIDKGTDISIEGFEISHSPNTSSNEADRYVIQIKDLMGTHSGSANNDPVTKNISIKNNIIHDSLNNDLLKIEKAAQNITVAGNMFYNQGGPTKDHHIDVNSVKDVTIENNIFFNNFAASNRPIPPISAFIVIKDSSLEHGTNTNCKERCDDQIGSENIVIRKNILAQWAEATGTQVDNPYIALGEEEQDFYVAKNVLIENNLFLGNRSDKEARAYFTMQSAKTVTIRNNTFSGDMPSLSYIARFRKNNTANVQNDNISFYNNIFSDPTGTMGCQLGICTGAKLFTTDTSSWNSTPTLDNNMFWNGNAAIPINNSVSLNYTNDVRRVVSNPELKDAASFVTPHWNRNEKKFNGGFSTIAEALKTLASEFSQSSNLTAAHIDKANAATSPIEDILGNNRGNKPDIGAFEMQTQASSSRELKSIDDTYVDGRRKYKNRNFGTKNTMLSDLDAMQMSLIKFNIKDLRNKQIVNAKLSISIQDALLAGSLGNHEIRLSSKSTWQEEDVTHTSAPTGTSFSPPVILQAPLRDQTYTLDVTQAIQDATKDYISFIVYPHTTDSLSIYTKEYNNGNFSPTLSVEYR